MSAPLRTYQGFRVVETYRGDTLRAVAARELADASRWAELADINALRDPYLVDDPALAGDGVVASGSTLLVPFSRAYAPVSTDAASVFGRDLRLRQRFLSATDAGDLELIEGSANLSQAVSHVLSTDIGELQYHLMYGCGARRMIGRGISPATRMLVDRLVRRCINADSRVNSVLESKTSVSGDVLRAELIVEAVDGTVVEASSFAEFSAVALAFSAFPQNAIAIDGGLSGTVGSSGIDGGMPGTIGNRSIDGGGPGSTS